jgi:hypothetical protein
MQTAFAIFGWSPEQFWMATPADYRQAADGWLKRYQPEAAIIGHQHMHHLKHALQKGNWNDGPE